MPQAPPPDLRRARAGALLAFATNGALPATLLVRYAEVKESLGLGEGAFGLVVVGFGLGAALALNLPAVLVRALGTRRTTAVGTGIIAVALTLAATGAGAGSVWLFLLGLLLAGATDPVVDVAQNGQGLAVQERYERSVLNSMHAGWSVGATAGGLVGTLAASAGVPLWLHLALWGSFCTAVMALAGRWFLPDRAAEVAHADAEPQADDTGRRRRGPGAGAVRLLLPITVLAVVGVSIEDIGNNWSAVLLATERGVPAANAGIGLTVLLAGQFVGRLLGDRFVDALGQRRAILLSVATLTAGLLVAAWAPWAVLTVAGLALAGLGCAVTVPVAFARADALPGLRAHTGLTWVSWSMRVASLVISPLVGGLAALSSLPIALSVVAVPAVLLLLALLLLRGGWRGSSGGGDVRA